MKILHFASGDLWAGAEVQLFHLSKKLAGLSQVELLVVLLNSGRLGDELRRAGINVFILEESQLSSLSILKKFNDLVKEFQPDIIHTHRNKENIIGGIVARLNRKKCIRTEHGAPEYLQEQINFRRIVLNWMDSFSRNFLQQKVIAVSHDLKNKLSKIYPPEKIEVLENSIDTDYIKKMSEEPATAVADLSVYNVAFVGRFVQVKRPDIFYLIAKSALSSESVKPINFHMVGDGPLKDSIALNIERDKLESKVHLYGFIENIAPFLKQMDLLVFTSDHEGLPMTLLEAMTLGVSVLSRNLPSIKRVLCNGECGFVTVSDAIDDYLNIILPLANKKLTVNNKIEMAYKQVCENYNVVGNAEKYLKLYTRLLSV